jgi:cell division protein FtsB
MIPKKRINRNNDWDAIISIALIVCVNVSIILFLIVGNVKLFIKKQDMKAQLVDLNQEVQKLAEKNIELDRVFYETSQQDYAEGVMRDEGLYKKEGEQVVVIVGNDQPKEMAPVNTRGDLLESISGFFNKLFSR